MKKADPVSVAALASMCLFCLPANSQQSVPQHVGTVVFSSGPAQLVSSDGLSRVVELGVAVRVGDQVITGSDAHVHLRMVDNGFVAVRPKSHLTVELYEYSEDRPAASRIRLKLDSGTTRSVTGKGGEAAKRNYRFNTPLAAIGLRGTDYTVWADMDVTRVAVARGTVSVAAFDDSCLASALGPCTTARTRDLSAATPHAYLEVSAANRVPVLVRPEQDPTSGNRPSLPPARPLEPRAEVSPTSVADSKQAAGQVIVERFVTTSAEAVKPDMSAPDYKLVWGRWSSYASSPQGGPAPVTSLIGGREITFSNDVFGLLREVGPVRLPTEGQFSFKMAGSDAYVVNGSSINAAQVQGGSFSVDFLNRTFSTSLQVRHASGIEQLQASGQVQFQGLLLVNEQKANMNVAGALANGGSEAAYLFDKSLASGGLFGALRWTR